MSRPSALRDTLRLPSTQTLEVVTVLASGDCFYDCIEKLLTLQFSKCGASFFASMPPLLRSCNSTTNGEADCGPSEIQIPSSQSMRNYVADQLTTEQLDLYQMYSTAGLHEYNFATGQTLEDLRLFAKKSGRTNGPGKCFWADEFALRKISDGLHLTLLIIDDQATRGASVGGAGMGRKRRRNDDNDEQAASSTDNRFVFIGTYPRAVILHRSRRQHYNAVVIDGNAITELEQLPLAVRSLWRVKGNAEENEAGSAKPPSKSDEGKQMNDNEKVKDCVLEEGGNEMLTHHQDLDQNVKQLHAVGRKNDSSTAQSTRSSPTQQTTLGNFYCGCAGFSSSSWVGNFYPKSLVGHNSDRQLDHYQQHFRTVEINSTFYGIPSESTVSKWAKVFANSFKVVVKAPKALTHEQSQLDCSVLSTFLARMKPLNDTLAVILIQCPRTLDVNVSSLQQIKHVLDEEEAMWYNGGIAFEFRNEATYFDEEVRSFLKQNSFALVMHPNSVGRSTVGTSVSGRGNCNLLEYQPEQLCKVAAMGAMTSSFVYLRLHGFNDEHRGEYTMDDLAEIAKEIHSWRVMGMDVFCFILNDLEPTRQPSPSSSTTRKSSSLQPWDKWCAMPKNAKQLEVFVYRLSNEDVPVAPKKPKSTLLSFFGKKQVCNT